MNTYYTRAQARFKAAPRSRGAEKNLRLALRRERAAAAEAAWQAVCLAREAAAAKAVQNMRRIHA